MPDILSVVRSHIDTNLSTNELIAMAGFTAQKDRSNINMVMLPGDFNVPEEGELSYWLPNDDKIKEVVAQHFDMETDYYATSTISDPSNLKIAIQTTEENQENAQNIVDYLRSQGYNGSFVTREFTTQPLLKTKIVAQQGDNLSAAQVRADLGVGEVVVESTGVLNSDITIQVGQDWHNINFDEPQESSFKTISY
jgi:hypothetical protein